MTKVEWKESYRQLRLARTKTSISHETLMNVFKEMYSYDFLPQQEVFIRLVRRYGSKLSDSKKHLAKIEQWRPEAKARADEHFKHLVYDLNPFLSLVPKSGGSFSGAYLPVPFITGEDDDY